MWICRGLSNPYKYKISFSVLNRRKFSYAETVPDYSKLTLTQAKRLEMDSQVRKSFSIAVPNFLLVLCSKNMRYFLISASMLSVMME